MTNFLTNALDCIAMDGWMAANDAAIVHEAIERINELEEALAYFASFAPDVWHLPDEQKTMVGALIPAGKFKTAYMILYGNEPTRKPLDVNK